MPAIGGREHPLQSAGTDESLSQDGQVLVHTSNFKTALGWENTKCCSWHLQLWEQAMFPVAAHAVHPSPHAHNCKVHHHQHNCQLSFSSPQTAPHNCMYAMSDYILSADRPSVAIKSHSWSNYSVHPDVLADEMVLKGPVV